MLRALLLILLLFPAATPAVDIGRCGLPLLAMEPEFVGENRGESEAFGAEKIVEYFVTEDARAAHEVTFKADGRAYVGDRLLQSSPDETILYVLSKEGKLYARPIKNRRGTIHHSSLVAGENVLCAGALVAENGRIMTLDNWSGHYHPTVRHLRLAMEWLRDKGVAPKSVRIEIAQGSAPNFLSEVVRDGAELLDKVAPDDRGLLRLAAVEFPRASSRALKRDLLVHRASFGRDYGATTFEMTKEYLSLASREEEEALVRALGTPDNGSARYFSRVHALLRSPVARRELAARLAPFAKLPD